jgi:hypothetical protein
MVEGDRLRLKEPPAGSVQLALGAQIDNGAQAQTTQLHQIVQGQLVQRIGTEQPTPPGIPSVEALVATEIAEVEGSLERDQA